ncbi:cytochrome c [Herbaspirillum sp. YR522]|uniref:c-type cytochrome n=1 Tax=Herbaspirillum sp. YR522 TaxID=1144342 RepID=UPI00026F918D|nr:cytochrome c [Herbaspirillum sp. YR522]EJM96304.1 cytochrome c, mono- and diheme variants family [Herbaspirillum sp. YR522]
MSTPLASILAALAWLLCSGTVLAQQQSLDLPAAPQAPAVAADPALQQSIERGRYLAVAGDCMACHTAPRGKPYAGGYAIESPLGTIYATNITPSTVGGIGGYSEQQFSRALRQGVRADGKHLYPAMPYTSYALLTDQDVRDLFAYFRHGVEPVDRPAAATALPFPFNMRPAMRAWNLLFLDRKPYTPDPTYSQQVNRGSYLVNGLAHCGACHTPRNVAMAEQSSRLLAGAALGPWWAPNITSDPVAGIGGWSDAELRQYLKTGRAPGKGQAAGPMAEAVSNSLQHLHDDDISAIIAYLRVVPAASGNAKPAFAQDGRGSDEAVLRGRESQNERDSLTTGAALFSANCASCHATDGRGSADQSYPSLSRNSATGAARADNLIAAILYGVERKVGQTEVLMPRFDAQSSVNPLGDAQIALIANYVLQQYGNPDVKVSQDDVRQSRQGGARPLLARAQPLMVPALALLALLVLGSVVLVMVRRRARS